MEKEEIAIFMGIDKEMKKLLEKGDNPFANYVKSMAELLGVKPEDLLKSIPVVKYYLAFYKEH